MPRPSLAKKNVLRASRSSNAKSKRWQAINERARLQREQAWESALADAFAPGELALRLRGFSGDPSNLVEASMCFIEGVLFYGEMRRREIAEGRAPKVVVGKDLRDGAEGRAQWIIARVVALFPSLLLSDGVPKLDVRRVATAIDRAATKKTKTPPWYELTMAWDACEPNLAARGLEKRWNEHKKIRAAQQERLRNRKDVGDKPTP